MRKNRIITITVASAVVVAFILYSFLTAKPTNTFSLETTKLSKGKISTSVTATGTIQPEIKVAVGTQVSGKIAKIYVDYNSVVTKGQVLAELEKTTLQSDLTSKELDLKSSKIEYEFQMKNFERSTELHNKKLISDIDYETAKYSYEKAESAYKRNVSDLVRVQTNLSYATIYSPIDGVVLSRAVEEGQTVAASFSTPTLFNIAKDLTKMQVVANVDEADIGEVQVGQRVTFAVDAYPNDQFEGNVTQVRLESTVTSNVVTYQVIVNAPNPNLKLKPGLTANIVIYTLEKEGVSVLPNKVFNYKPDSATLATQGYKILNSSEPSKSKSVWTEEGTTFVQTPVITGVTDGINTEVVSGLSDSQNIVLDAKMVDIKTVKAQESSPFLPKFGGQKQSGAKKP